MVKTITSSRVIWLCWYLLLSITSINVFLGCSEVDISTLKPILNNTKEVSLSPEQEKLVSLVVNTELKEGKQLLFNSGTPHKKKTIFLKILDKNPSQNFLANFKDDIVVIKPASLGLWRDEESAYDPQDKWAHACSISIANIEINDRTNTAQLYVIYGQDESGECTGVRWYFLRNGANWEFIEAKREPLTLPCDY